MIRVAIIGRPNVGKSTLFNRITGKALALVDPTPGVTRDRIEYPAKFSDLPVMAIDTAGIDLGGADSLESRLYEQTQTAAMLSDVILFLTDSRDGITKLDHDIASWLRRVDKPVIMATNKAEKKDAELTASEGWALGLGEPVLMSGLQGEGLADIAERLREAAKASGLALDDEELARQRDDATIKTVILGRPNAGKSSLVNKLIGEARMLTGPEPGLTRDSVTVPWEWRGQKFALIDTAGLRKRSKVDLQLDKLSAKASKQALDFAHVAVLLLDATQPMERQDASIAEMIAEEGRSCVIGLNKWDLIEDKKEALSLARYRIENRVPQLKGLPIVPMSALHGEGIDPLLKAIIVSNERWNRRITTNKLNRWLASIIERNPPPTIKGLRSKIRYISQTDIRPSRLTLFGSRLKQIPEHYLRFMINAFRKDFDMDGQPVRLFLRESQNPYDKS